MCVRAKPKASLGYQYIYSKKYIKMEGDGGGGGGGAAPVKEKLSYMEMMGFTAAKEEPPKPKPAVSQGTNDPVVGSKV